MRLSLLSALAALAYANSNAGSKISFCSTAQPADLDATAFAGLTWIPVGGVGTFGQTGSSTNILTYPTWDTDVAQKAKGITDAGSPTLDVARDPSDAGQTALRAAALTNLNYALKIEKNDKLTSGGTNTIIYQRGLVSGPTHPNGKNEDFDLDIFTFAFQQREVVVPAT